MNVKLIEYLKGIKQIKILYTFSDSVVCAGEINFNELENKLEDEGFNNLCVQGMGENNFEIYPYK